MLYSPPRSNFFRAQYAHVFGPIVGRFILLLTNRSQKTGLAQVTELRYEEFNAPIVVRSSRGTRADWYWDILADPHVSVRVRPREFRGFGEPSIDPVRIANFLEYRLKGNRGWLVQLCRRRGCQ